MKIIIPTYRRLDRQSTLAALHYDLWKDVILVCRPDELDEAYRIYGSTALKESVGGVIGLPPGVDDLWKTRQWIWDTFAPQMRFVMCDDDIRSFEKRLPLEAAQRRISSWVDQSDMLVALEEQLDLGAGLAAPRSHWAPPGKDEVTHAADAVQFVMFDGPRLAPLGIRWDRCKVEDRDVTMQVLSHGIDVVTVRKWSFSAKMSGEGEGGINESLGINEDRKLSWGDRARLAREWMGDLARLWPDHVTPSENSPTGFRMHRARLLKESRERLRRENMPEEEKICEICSCAARVSKFPDLCDRCGQAVGLLENDLDLTRRVARYLSNRGTSAPRAPTEGSKRGRPALGANHPVILRMRNKGAFRCEAVSDLYGSRNSASVSLSNMVKAGHLKRVGLGLYEVSADADNFKEST